MPAQVRGPMLNGRYAHFEGTPLPPGRHRSGSK
jgi:hypothetical protein